MRRIKRVMEMVGRRFSGIMWWICRNVSSIVIIILLAVYCFTGYRTYVIQKKCFEIVDLAYQVYQEYTKELEGYNERLEERNNALEDCYEILKYYNDYLEKLTGSPVPDPEGREVR